MRLSLLNPFHFPYFDKVIRVHHDCSTPGYTLIPNPFRALLPRRPPAPPRTRLDFGVPPLEYFRCLHASFRDGACCLLEVRDVLFCNWTPAGECHTESTGRCCGAGDGTQALCLPGTCSATEWHPLYYLATLSVGEGWRVWHSATPPDLELTATLLLQPPKCWGYKCL